MFGNIHFFGRQPLPYCGNWSNDSESEEKRQLSTPFVLRSLDDQVLVRWLNSGLKTKYTSSEIQSEIFQIMSWQVFREIVQNIQSSVIYTIVADETADISNKEQLEFWITVG